VVRAANGHNQIKDYVSRFNICLPGRVAVMQAIKSAVADPEGAASVAIAYSLIPYYRSKLAQTNSAKWHTAQSSKAIDYQQLKTRF
jgi:hypothetical protein